MTYGYAVTLAGVALGSSYRELQRRQAKGHRQIKSVRSFFRSVLRSIDFWMGICASPMVFALILQSAGGASTAALTAIGLQNGFCCTGAIPIRPPSSGSPWKIMPTGSKR